MKADENGLRGDRTTGAREGLAKSLRWRNSMPVKTTLNERGEIGIPQPIRESDHLQAGDAFDLERLTPGHYLLSKQKPVERFRIATGSDGLPVIRVDSGTITSQQVKDLESQTP